MLTKNILKIVKYKSVEVKAKPIYGHNEIQITTFRGFIIFWRQVVPFLWDPLSSSSNLS